MVWVHVITDDVAIAQGKANKSLGLFDVEHEKLHALFGYGQGGDPKKGDDRDRFTAQQSIVEGVRDRLSAGGLTTLLTHSMGNNYRGRDEKRLNQWFNHLGLGFDRVASLQLEIKETGFRDTEENAIKTGAVIAGAIKK